MCSIQWYFVCRNDVFTFIIRSYTILLPADALQTAAPGVLRLKWSNYIVLIHFLVMCLFLYTVNFEYPTD